MFNFISVSLSSNTLDVLFCSGASKSYKSCTYNVSIVDGVHVVTHLSHAKVK